jgi:hypothetical protein
MTEHGAGRRTWACVLAIFVLAAGVRFAFWSEIRGTALDRWQRFDQSDMATYVEQANRIRAGDPLQPDPYHPYHSWQTVAPPDKWLALYGPHAFHQAPLYSYVLAGVTPFAGADFALVKALQLLCGAGTCVLLFLIARHAWNATAGWVAGLLAAVYGPLVFLEAQLLREGPALFCILAMLTALVRLLEREDATPRQRLTGAAGLGLAAGAFSMFHEMGNVVTLVLLLALAASSLRAGSLRASAARAGLVVACLFAGWFAGFSPLFVRNLAVGAAPFSVSCRTTVNFVESNVADAADGGATFAPPSATAVRVLDESKGSGLAALAGTWRSYDGDLGRVFANLRAKFAANWIPWEVPDNTSFEFFREHANTLRFAPTFACLFPLGFAGLLLSLRHVLRRRSRPAELTKQAAKRLRKQGESAAPAPDAAPRAVASHLALLLLFTGLVSALSLVHTVARFRMYLVPILIVYAGIAVAVLWGFAREKRFGAAAVLALTVLAGLLLQRAVPTSAFVRGLRQVDYAVACKLAIEDGEVPAAQGFAEEARVAFPGDGLVYSLAGSELERKGDRANALLFYRRALELQPEAQIARDGLRRLEPRR